MTAIVAAFNAIYPRNSLTVHMGWQFMCLVKMVRGAAKPHADSALDQVAYAALAAEEVAEQLHQPAALCEDEGCPHHGMPHVCLTSVETPEQHKERVASERMEQLLAHNRSLEVQLDTTHSALADFVCRFDLTKEYMTKEQVLAGQAKHEKQFAKLRERELLDIETINDLRAELAGSTRAMQRAQDEVQSLLAEKRHLHARNKELEEKVQILNNEVEAKVRELMSNMRHEAPCAHNTDEPKATRAEYVDPFDQYGDMRSPMHRLVGDRDPARGGLAYPKGKDAPTPQ